MPKPQIITREWRDAQTPERILAILKAGNKAFARGQTKTKDHAFAARKTASAQHPMAIVLSCIDSRAPAEIIFDLGIGDIFNARVAGNIVSADIVGCMELACKVAGAKLVVVMGHTNCGAVMGACDGLELGNVSGILAQINPAVKSVTDVPGERTSANEQFVTEVAKQNVLRTRDQILSLSPVLKEMADSDQIRIVGCMYDLQTRKVNFL